MLRLPRSAGRLLALCAVAGCTPSPPAGDSLPPSEEPADWVRFRSDRVELLDGDDSLGIQTVAIGRNRDAGDVGERAVEWWTANDREAEQSWTVRSPAPGNGPLRVRLRLAGATATRGEDLSLWLKGANGGSWRVDRLRAVDARGSDLPTRFVLSQAGFDIVVDDAGAVYPVEVDPFYTTPDWEVHGTAETGAPADVAMGDFDRDGYDDLAALSGGAARVYRGTPGGLEETAAVSLGADGDAVASVGDIDGDGYDDLVVGVPTDAAIVVYTGSPAGLSEEGTTILSERTGVMDWFGYTLAGAGDVNGDGFDDVVVGAYAAEYAAVFYGSASGLAETPAFEVTGSDMLGWQVGGAGDVNGDGYDDIAIAGYDVDTYLYYGSGAGLTRSPDVVLRADANAQAVAGVGDLDDDGYGDFAIAYTDDTYVYPGGATGLDPTTYTLLTDGSGSLADVGDVNVDGLDDLVVGACGGFDPTILLYLGDPRFVSSPPHGFRDDEQQRLLRVRPSTTFHSFLPDCIDESTETSDLGGFQGLPWRTPAPSRSALCSPPRIAHGLRFAVAGGCSHIAT